MTEAWAGVGILVRKAWAPSREHIRVQPLIEGRALQLSVDSGLHSIVVYGIHNFGFDASACSELTRDILRHKQRADDDPTSVLVFVPGEWNYMATSEDCLKMETPTQKENHRGGYFSATWERCFGNFLEFQSTKPTHASPGRLTRIDRA